MKLFNYTRCLCLSFSLLVLASCNVENPIDGEQYIKQVYLVGAYDKLQGKEVAYVRKSYDKSELRRQRKKC